VVFPFGKSFSWHVPENNQLVGGNQVRRPLLLFLKQADIIISFKKGKSPAPLVAAAVEGPIVD